MITPATSTTGFFQPSPQPGNQWDEEPTLQRAGALFLPSELYKTAAPKLSKLGDSVNTPEIYAALTNAEALPPYIDGGGFSAFGVPKDSAALVTSPGWKMLQDFALREGMVPTGHDEALGGSARVVQSLMLALWAGNSAMNVCPSSMQDGAVSVLKADLKRAPGAAYPDEWKAARTKVFQSALSRLLDRDPRRAWTSGQWMTERIGGSDVSGTETVAALVGKAGEGETDVDGLPLGPWSVSGFKWFSSATDCGCAIVLAQTSKGISCFFAPTRKKNRKGETVMNGIRIQRLKNKMGTKALPTAELEIRGMRAWLLGEEGRGVAIIATVLNVTRYHNAIRAPGFLGRGLVIARAFARVRKFPSRKAPDNVLNTIPLFAKTIAGVTLRYRADTMLAMFVAALLGSVETDTRPSPLVPRGKDAELLLRLLTSVAKCANAKHGIAGLQECMEALGGVGYLENNETQEINVARLFRDANVFSIWEGTFDVLATDTVKVLRGRQQGEVEAVLGGWVKATLGSIKGMEEEKKRVLVALDKFGTLPATKDDLMPHARLVVKNLGDLVCATLLLADAGRDGDALAREMARRFVRQAYGPEEDISRWRETTRWDRRIAFGYVHEAAKL